MRGSTAAFTETLKGSSKLHYALLTVLDSFISAFLVAPLVVCYWRSVWHLMEIYVYQEDELLSACISTVIGIVGHIAFTLLQGFLENHFHPDKNRLLFYIFSRFYTVCYAFVCVNGWRGPWMLINKYTDNGHKTVLVTMCVAIVALGGMKTLRNVSAAPFALVTDYVNGYFQVATMFQAKVRLCI